MLLHKTFTKYESSSKLSGFTLVEILVVFAIIGFFAAISVGWGFDIFRTYSLVDNEEKTVTDLMRSRSGAQANVENVQDVHGINFEKISGDINEEKTIEISDPDQGERIKYITIKTNGEIIW